MSWTLLPSTIGPTNRLFPIKHLSWVVSRGRSVLTQKITRKWKLLKVWQGIYKIKETHIYTLLHILYCLLFVTKAWWPPNPSFNEEFKIHLLMNGALQETGAHLKKYSRSPCSRFRSIAVHKTTPLAWIWSCTRNPLIELCSVKTDVVLYVAIHFSQLPGNEREGFP